MKEAARDAIRRIQERLGNVEGGRLSLAGPNDAAGALSPATAPQQAGQLTPVTDMAPARDTDGTKTGVKG